MIEGTRIRLRARDVSDAERAARWLNDPEVAKPLGERYLRSVLAMENIEREFAPEAPPEGALRLAIETSDGLHIGALRLFDIAAEDRSARLGIFIGEAEYRGCGYGTDTLRTLLGFAFGEMNLNRVELGVLAYNERAMACYRKCGFVEEARLRQDRYERGVYYDAIVMSVLRDDWLRLEA